MNEAVLRSPKWMRNFADFEINTGKDIKGEPSLKRKKQMEQERLRQEQERLKKEEEEYQRIKEEEEVKRKKEKEEKDKLFDHLFSVVESYIYSNYKECDISVPINNELIIEKHDLLYKNDLEFSFKVTLLNYEARPKFDVMIKIGNKILEYTVSGLSYAPLKIFILNSVYEYYKYSSKYGSKEKTHAKSNNYKSEPKESDEKANKRRRYDLLKQTIEGYRREYTKLVNSGAKKSELDIVMNQINNAKDKLNNMNKQYQFESKYYLKHLKSIFS